MHAIQDMNMFEDWHVDPIYTCKGNWASLKLTRAVALNILSMIAGEASSETVFSISSRVVKFDRARMSAEQVASTTFIENNRLVRYVEI